MRRIGSVGLARELWSVALLPAFVVVVSGLWERTRAPISAECVAQGKACGTIELASGERVACGECGPYEVCGADGMENVCCAPTTCEEQRATCGEMSDGCGGTLDCGRCGAGQVCGGDGRSNVCVAAAECVPVTCESLDLDCGRVSDGCGGTLECGTCAGGLTCGGSGAPNRCSAASSRPNAALASGCFDLPKAEITPLNQTPVRLGVWTGERAVDFTLEDADGERVQLSKLLETAPVVLELGSRTCGAFRHNSPAMDELARRFRGRAHFLTVYTIEAHPSFPDPSPFRGRPFPLGFSDVAQPRTLAERHRAAAGLALAPERRVLVDALDNPVWCTYGPAANAAFLIRRDGVIEAAHAWLDTGSFASSLQLLLATAER